MGSRFGHQQVRLGGSTNGCSTFGLNYWVEPSQGDRGYPSARQARCYETGNFSIICWTQRRRRAGAQKFPAAASVRILLPRVSSATARLRRLFSVSSCFNRRTWSMRRRRVLRPPPYSALQR